MTAVARREEREVDYGRARRAMIDSQLRVSGVNEEFVLATMGRVPRENFVPDAVRSLAYVDRAVPLGDGHFLPAPLVHGRMLAEAAPLPADRALVVDAGSGYLAALVRELAGQVEVVTPAAAAAMTGGAGDFTVLLVDGAVEQLPEGLCARLAEGARVVTGTVTQGVTRLAAGRKVAGAVSLYPLAEIGMPILPEFAAPKRWTFT